jgi:predicted cation transporter
VDGAAGNRSFTGVVLPFKLNVEHNLEVFFLDMGLAAVTISWQWSGIWLLKPESPVMIQSLPSIFQVVLIFGLLIYYFNKPFYRAVRAMANKLSIRIFIFILWWFWVISSIISVIVTSVILLKSWLHCQFRETTDQTGGVAFFIGLERC